MSRRALAAFVVLLAACERRRPTPEIVAASAEIVPAPIPAPTATASASAQQPAAVVQKRDGFVRHPPHSMNSDADAVDACTQVGGNYFSCRGAYHEETDPVLKRYLFRIAQGHAAGESGYLHKGQRIQQGELPHAEVPFQCDPRKPCKATNEHGELNSPTSCLARAHEAFLMHDVAAARAAHAHACKCDPKDADFPGYNQTPFLCDATGKPAFIAPRMKADEAKDIVDCAICQPERGPSACRREIERLKATDPALATHVETKQIARCKTPDEGPYDWE